MTAWVIDMSGFGYLHHGRYRSEDGAIAALLKRMKGSVEIRCMGAGPKEVTAEWLMANCRAVENL